MALPRPPALCLRDGTLADLDALCSLELRAFATNRMSRRSLRRLLGVASAEFIIAQVRKGIANGGAGRAQGGEGLAGVAVLLFRANSAVGRLYSIAVASPYARRGIASALVAAAEATARRRKCAALRLEVHEGNRAAVMLYRKAGYRELGRYREYYEDLGDALRFEKRLCVDG